MVYGINREGRGKIMYCTKVAHSIAVVWVMQMGGGNKGIVDSCTHKNEGTKILYRPS